MADHGRDDDRILRWVLRKAHGLRNPSADQLRNYQHWHAISRRDGFDGLEPDDWRSWPTKPIPPGAGVPEPSPPSARREMRADEAQEAAERPLRRRSAEGPTTGFDRYRRARTGEKRHAICATGAGNFPGRF
jgi:hypothetical protein